MVSRRKILSRSRDDLTLGDEPQVGFLLLLLLLFLLLLLLLLMLLLKVRSSSTQDTDTWYSKEKLYKDHVEEVKS